MPPAVHPAQHKKGVPCAPWLPETTVRNTCKTLLIITITRETMGFYVIKDGERAAVWSMGGDVTYVDGPRIFFTLFKSVKLLPYHYAGMTRNCIHM